MKRLLLVGAALLGLAATVHADITGIITNPGGTTGSVQVNRRGALFGDSQFTYSTGTYQMSVPSIAVSTIAINGVTYSWPTTPGAPGQFLQGDGAGGIDWVDGTTTAISSAVALGVYDESTQISSTTSIIKFDTTPFALSFLSGATAYVSLDQTVVGFLASTQTYSAPHNINNGTSSPATTITSSGSANGISVVSNGVPSGGLQNATGGAVNIKMNAVGEGLVVYSSITDSQEGSSFVRVVNDAPGYNDPLVWIEDAGSSSNPALRIDSYAPDIEMVNSSTDTTHGMGKWEPAAIPYQGTQLQINSRAYDNTTFERVAEWRMRQKGGGLVLYPAVNGENGSPATTGTSQLIWVTTDSVREVGLRGPKATSASWYWTLPSTFNNSGQIMYQSTDGPDRNLAFTSSGANAYPLVSRGTSAPVWSSSITVTQILSGLSDEAISIGNGALANYIPGGAPSIGIGSDALRDLTTGDGNIGVGRNTLDSISTGTYNTGYGEIAGSSLINGNFNTFLGTLSGVGDWTGSLSGNDNIMIGEYTGPTGISDQSNSISIGAYARANCSNCMVLGSKNDSLITRLNVGISTDTPRERLHLGGGNLRLDSNGIVKLYDSDNSNYIGLKSSAAVPGDVTWTLPAAEGIAGQQLETDGHGSWQWRNSGAAWVNVKTSTYGIVNDGRALTVSMTAGDNLVTASASVFTSADVGKLIGITNSSSSTLSGLYISASSWTVTRMSGSWSEGDVGRSITISTAGVAGAELTSTIVRFTSATQVDIADLASTSVTNGLGAKADMMATTIASYVSPTQVRANLNAAFSTNTAAGYMGTDNTTAINNLITATVAAGGGTLYFPRGIYLVASANNITPAVQIYNATNLTLQGESGSTIQAVYNSPSHLIEARFSDSVTFRDLTLDGGYPIHDPNVFNQDGINYVESSINLTVEGCSLRNINDTGIADRTYWLSANYASKTSNKKAKTLVNRNRFYNVKTGFNNKLGARWGIISNNHFEAGECAAKIDGELPGGQSLPEKSADWIIANNVAVNMGDRNAAEVGVFELQENIANVTLSNNVISDSTYVDCLRVDGGQTVKDSYSLNIVNNVCSNMAYGYGLAFRPDGAGDSTSTIRSVNITGNMFREVDKANVYFNYNSSGTIQNLSITNNQFTDWNLHDQGSGNAEGGVYLNNTGPINGLLIANNVFQVTGSPSVADSAALVWATANVSSYTITNNVMMNTSNLKLLVQVNSGASLTMDRNFLYNGRINSLGNLTLRNHYASDSPIAGFNASTITVENSRFIKGSASYAYTSAAACRFEEFNNLYEGYTSTFSFSGGAFRADVSKSYTGGTTTLTANGSGPAFTVSVSSSNNPAIRSNGVIQVKSAGDAPTAVSGYSLLFSSSSPAEMFVMDASGNATQISPHDPEGRWVYDSVNQRTHRAVYIPMEDFFEVMESVLNRKLIFQSREEYLDYRKKNGLGGNK